MIETATHTTTSRDGTAIAYDRSGNGPSVVIVGGGPTDRTANTPLARLLASRFTVFNYDRRGRGASGNARPYSLDGEYEDVGAVLEAAGGRANVFGSSSGGVVALEAAARGLPIERLAIWEPPFVVDDSRPPPPADYAAQVESMVAAGRRGDALELFFTGAVDLPVEMVAQIRQAPFWSDMESMAHTLVYDAAVMGDFTLPAGRFAGVNVPTLVIDGGTTPWMTSAAEAVASVLPAATRRTLTGQPHNVDPSAIAPVLAEFFAERSE